MSVFSIADTTAISGPPVAFSVCRSHQEGYFFVLILPMGKLRHLGSKLAFPNACNAPGAALRLLSSQCSTSSPGLLWRRCISITPRFCCMHGNFNSLPTVVVMKQQGLRGEAISFIRAAKAVGKSSFYAEKPDLIEP